ncbi:MAG: hypothetical protein AABZ32_12915, partial [Bacteroidota bacterium]
MAVLQLVHPGQVAVSHQFSIKPGDVCPSIPGKEKYITLVEKAKKFREKKTNQVVEKLSNKSKTLLNSSQLVLKQKKRLAEISLQRVCFGPKENVAMSANPRFDEIIDADSPNEEMMDLTGETVQSFLGLYKICETALNPRRKGKRSKVGPMDQLIVLLSYYKVYPNLYELAR